MNVEAMVILEEAAKTAEQHAQDLRVKYPGLAADMRNRAQRYRDAITDLKQPTPTSHI